MDNDRLNTLVARLRRFADDRDWNQFHSPKNLAMAITAEAGELAAEFQWLPADESNAPDADHLARIQAEVADIALYLLRLSDRLGFDLIDAANAKMDLNERRYPADLTRGSAKKYNEY